MLALLGLINIVLAGICVPKYLHEGGESNCYRDQ